MFLKSSRLPQQKAHNEKVARRNLLRVENSRASRRHSRRLHSEIFCGYARQTSGGKLTTRQSGTAPSRLQCSRCLLRSDGASRLRIALKSAGTITLLQRCKARSSVAACFSVYAPYIRPHLSYPSCKQRSSTISGHLQTPI